MTRRGKGTSLLYFGNHIRSSALRALAPPKPPHSFRVRRRQSAPASAPVPRIQAIMRQIWSAAFLLFSVCMAEGLHAQTVPSPIRYIERKNSVGIFGGYLKTDTGTLDAGPTSMPLVGIRYDMQVTGPLSVGASVAVGQSERSVFQREEPTDTELNLLGETEFGLLMAEAGFRFQLTGPRTWHGIAPYIGASAGVVDDYTALSSLESSLGEEQVFDFGPGFAASGALGTDFFLTERLSIRAEARDQLWRYTYPSTLSGTGVEEKEWVHNPGFSIGAAFHF